MRARLLRHRNPVSAQELKPSVDVIRCAQDKANVIQALTEVRKRVRLMQGEIVAARGEIYIAGIGPPLNLHPQKIDVETLTGHYIHDIERDMTEATSYRGAFGHAYMRMTS